MASNGKEFSLSSFADMMCQVNLTMKNRSTETGTIVDPDLHKQQEIELLVSMLTHCGMISWHRFDTD